MLIFKLHTFASADVLLVPMKRIAQWNSISTDPNVIEDKMARIIGVYRHFPLSIVSYSGNRNCPIQQSK